MAVKPMAAAGKIRVLRLLGRHWLSEKAFEIELSRPPDFSFAPGQHIRLLRGPLQRDYSPITAPADETLGFCIRHRPEGRMSALLAALARGSRLRCAGPDGYFSFRPSARPAVFVATGTGIAPFVSMVRAGVRPFGLIHGVSGPGELYYQALFRSAARWYCPCLPKTATGAQAPADAFYGDAGACLASRLQPGVYDFYLCGRSEMVRSVTLLADDLYPGSSVFTETFY